ncbi:MAG: hypothetical protein Q9198_010827, partial [Flavoplaca austrocitrina]
CTTVQSTASSHRQVSSAFCFAIWLSWAAKFERHACEPSLGTTTRISSKFAIIIAIIFTSENTPDGK